MKSTFSAFVAPKARVALNARSLCRSSRCTFEVEGAVTVTIRDGIPARRSGSSRFVSRNGPR